MAEKFPIYANGWGGEIYASQRKNGSWTITFEIDAGEFGLDRKTIQNIRSPKQFVHALYGSDGIEMDPKQIYGALTALYATSPAFALACAIFNETEDGETDLSEEDFLKIYSTFLKSASHLPPDFDDGKRLGIKLFSALLDYQRNREKVQTIQLDGTEFCITWDNRANADLREFQIAKSIAEHCSRAEWKKLSGHSHAAIGNGQIGQKIRKFVTGYLAENGSMPIGDFSVEGISVRFN